MKKCIMKLLENTYILNKFCLKTKAKNLQLKNMKYNFLQKWQGFGIKIQPFYVQIETIYRTLHLVDYV